MSSIPRAGKKSLKIPHSRQRKSEGGSTFVKMNEIRMKIWTSICHQARHLNQNCSWELVRAELVSKQGTKWVAKHWYWMIFSDLFPQERIGRERHNVNNTNIVMLNHSSDREFVYDRNSYHRLFLLKLAFLLRPLKRPFHFVGKLCSPEKKSSTEEITTMR
jgi:hypothetical protein